MSALDIDARRQAVSAGQRRSAQRKPPVARLAVLSFALAALGTSSAPFASAAPPPTAHRLRSPAHHASRRLQLPASTLKAAPRARRHETLRGPHGQAPRPGHFAMSGHLGLGVPAVGGTLGDQHTPCATGYRAPNLVGIDFNPDGRGYWAVSDNGDVYTCGDARFWGSMGNIRHWAPVQAIAALPNGHGYWLATRDGGIYSFGQARFYGRPSPGQAGGAVVGLAASPSGHGYWLATARGGVFAFGDARFFGSLGNSHLPAPVAGIAALPTGRGYWLATANGQVFSFGSARNYGGLNGTSPVVAIASDNDGSGYWLLSPNGSVHAFGSARLFGQAMTTSLVRASSFSPNPSSPAKATATKRPAALPLPVSAQSERPLGTFTVTCYDLTGPTASGSMAGPQSVAVDPRVIPLGTRIYIQGVGERTADDTGGAITGYRLDIWEPTWAQCANWGVEERAVYTVP
ncbi:MAG: 3D domain-containing protein [Acidimicrobiales bacterium]